MSDPLFYLCPYRFTVDPPAMIRFYETLGLVTSVGTQRDGFAVLRGHGGRLGVHDLATSAASTTSTGICFETPDADLAAEHCRYMGLEASVVDEAFGRRVDVLGTEGRSVVINEEMQDFYGYREGPADARPSIDVLAVWFTDDFGAAAHWYAHFGFHSEDKDNHDWRELRGEVSAGVIGLHTLDRHRSKDTMSLGFASTEPLEAVVERLRSAGYTDAVITTEGAIHVEVTDPDGFHTEIHPSQIAS